MYLFNVRVYGILLNANNEVLISDEKALSVAFTKFPGGGLEYGEGLIDALKREYMEECNLEIEVLRHVYTTDFYEKSSFNESQIISIYYQIQALGPIKFDIKTKPFDFANVQSLDKEEVFRFLPASQVKPSDFTFRTDQEAWKAFSTLAKL